MCTSQPSERAPCSERADTLTPRSEALVGASDLKPLGERSAKRLIRSTYHARSKVNLGFTIYSISKVNPVEQTFDADIRLYCRWNDSLMAHDPDMISLRSTGRLHCGTIVPRRHDGFFPDAVVKVIDPALVVGTRPRFELANAKSVLVVPGSEICYLSPNDELGWVTLEARYRGTFQQNFNLIPFPFDVQELSIIIRMSAFPDRGRYFTAFDLKGVGLQQEIKDWIKLAEWTRYEPSCSFECDSRGRARTTIQMLLKRKATYHVQNVMVVYGCITVCCFFGFAINLEGLEERLTVASTMFLTAIAFKIVVANDIPKVNYSTIMDIYINGCLIFMFAVMLAMFALALVARFQFQLDIQDHGTILWHSRADVVCLIGFFSSFALFHAWIIHKICHAKALNAALLEGKQTATDASDALRAALRRSAATDRLATQDGSDTADDSDAHSETNTSETYSVPGSNPGLGRGRSRSKAKADANLSGSFCNRSTDRAVRLRDLNFASSSVLTQALPKEHKSSSRLPRVSFTESTPSAIQVAAEDAAPVQQAVSAGGGDLDDKRDGKNSSLLVSSFVQ